MRILGLLAGLTTLSLLQVATSSCGAPTYPGTTEGQFAITGTLLENTCAPGLDPRESLSFLAELRRNDGVGYWRQEGGALISGTMSDDGRFHFVSRITIDAYGPDPELGTAGCSLVQSESIDGVLTTVEVGDGGDAALDAGDAALDAGVDASQHADGGSDAGASATFVGDNTITISQAPGSNCALLLASNGGDFPAFPCQASYSLTGTAN